MTDIGTGSYTIIAQTAAETMGVPLERVQVTLGDSRHPASAGSGGQWARQAPPQACTRRASACAARWAKLGFDGDTADFANGRIQAGGRTIKLAEAGTLSAEDGIAFGDFKQGYDVGTYAGISARSPCMLTRERRASAACLPYAMAAGFSIRSPHVARSSAGW